MEKDVLLHLRWALSRLPSLLFNFYFLLFSLYILHITHSYIKAYKSSPPPPFHPQCVGGGEVCRVCVCVGQQSFFTSMSSTCGLGFFFTSMLDSLFLWTGQTIWELSQFFSFQFLNIFSVTFLLLKLFLNMILSIVAQQHSGMRKQTSSINTNKRL